MSIECVTIYVRHLKDVASTHPLLEVIEVKAGEKALVAGLDLITCGV
jgi:hypothetical protein